MELASIVNQFIYPRPHREMVEQRTVVITRTGRRRSTIIRSAHHTTLPPYLTALEWACHPGSSDMAPSGAFESSPVANLNPLDVWISITSEVAGWCHDLHVRAGSEREQMRRLVGARHADDTRMGDLLTDARRWQHDARVAVGEDEPLRTVNAVCPMCQHRNVLEMRSDGGFVRCRRCDMSWDEATVGLLAAMLANNRGKETLSILA